MLIAAYGVVAVTLTIFSYGFIDANLTLNTSQAFSAFHHPLHALVYGNRLVAGAVFLGFLAALFALYAIALRTISAGAIGIENVKRIVVLVAAILVLSFPALTYDLFNYMTTAKVLFTHRENPYVVMPVEIPNEPYLSFTRAANKVALYGPVWLAMTGVPHMLGGGDIWRTILAFKIMNAVFYLLMCSIVWRVTKSAVNVAFFALNPLVLIEVLVSGHNDIVMMVFAVSALLLSRAADKARKMAAWMMFTAAVFVKGAVLPLAPLMFIRWPLTRVWQTAWWIMLAVFFVFAPLREELYPWYAVWCLPFAALLPWDKRYAWVRGLAFALSLGLELRHVPYMVMGYYEGPGPMLRLVLTAVPIVGYVSFTTLRRLFLSHPAIANK